MNEVWKDIKGYEGLYQVSNLGRVKSVKRNLTLKPCNRNRYLIVLLSKNGIKKAINVHRLVAQAFIPNPDDKRTVNHIDGNKQNNCVDNLEWCSQSENVKHAYDNKLKVVVGERNPAHKLTTNDVLFIRKNYKPRDCVFGLNALSKKFNVNKSTILRVIRGVSWHE